jgi:hypothetical protein
VSEEGFDLCLAYVYRVAFTMEEDEAADPGQVALFGAVGVVF